MHLPKYTTHEIHSMPGGYVGDPFAGHMYHAGTDLGAYVDTNFQDGVHMRMAAAAVAPEDGKVRRILDQGTSIGQFATSMKRRFPDAEVWGIDVGGPMVRYAHMKAVDMGVQVHFAQRLCEETGFPDNHFDIVTSNLLFHEVTKAAAGDIIRESYRVLRPGGVFSPTDANDPHQTAHAKFTWWYNYRWNHEDWFLDWMQVDFTGEMERAGFKVVEVAKQRGLRPPLHRHQGLASAAHRILGTRLSGSEGLAARPLRLGNLLLPGCAGTGGRAGNAGRTFLHPLVVRVLGRDVRCIGRPGIHSEGLHFPRIRQGEVLRCVFLDVSEDLRSHLRGAGQALVAEHAAEQLRILHAAAAHLHPRPALGNPREAGHEAGRGHTGVFQLGLGDMKREMLRWRDARPPWMSGANPRA